MAIRKNKKTYHKLKDMVRSRERHLLNQANKGLMRGSVRRAKAAIVAGSGDAAELVRQAAGLVDRAASKGAIHRNAANRRKSRLARQLNAARIA